VAAPLPLLRPGPAAAAAAAAAPRPLTPALLLRLDLLARAGTVLKRAEEGRELWAELAPERGAPRDATEPWREWESSPGGWPCGSGAELSSGAMVAEEWEV